MKNVLWVLFSFNGKVSRTVWWACNAAFVTVLVAAFMLPMVAAGNAAEAEYEQVWSLYCSGTPWDDGPECLLDPTEFRIMQAAEREYLQASEASEESAFAFVFLGMLLVGWPSYAVGAKRLHDTGNSGWWLLLGFVPYVGGLVLFVWLGFWPGREKAVESTGTDLNAEEETV